MTKLILDGWIVKEGNDMENKLFFYSNEPVSPDGDEYSAQSSGDNVFVIELPIRMLMATNEPQKCKITIDLEK
jgi:hypothetical protein